MLQGIEINLDFSDPVLIDPENNFELDDFTYEEKYIHVKDEYEEIYDEYDESYDDWFKEEE